MTPQDRVYRENNSPLQTKVCSKCGGDPQPLENFIKDSRRPDGHTNVCKMCSNAHAREYRLMIRNNPSREKPLNAQQILASSDGILSKLCSKCGKVKPVEAFFRCANPSGYQSRCKKCTEEDRKKRTDKRISARDSLSIPSSKVCTNSTCIHLGASQPTTNFFTNNGSIDGFMYQCKDCVIETNAKWRKSNPDKRREAAKKQKRRYYAGTRESKWHIRITNQIKQRAKKKGIPFDMKPTDLFDLNTGKVPEFCPIFPHIRLDYSAGPDRRRWATVDKIVPQLGYTKGNVWVISMAANVWKDNGSNPSERERIIHIMRGREKKRENSPQTELLFPE